MKTAFIHVGMDKTGSKSIQRFYSGVSDYLFDQGFIYPTINDLELGFFYNHTSWCSVLLSDDHFSDNSFEKFNGHDGHESAFSFTTDWFEKINNLVRNNYNHSIIISSEAFYSMPFYGILSLKKILERMGFSKFVVIFFVDSASNRYRGQTAQRIVSGAKIKPPHIQEIAHYISRYSKIFGNNSVTLVDYRRTRGDGGVIPRFSELVGLVHPKSAIEINENSTLSAEALHLIHQIDLSGDPSGVIDRSYLVTKVALLDFATGLRGPLKLKRAIANAIDYFSKDYSVLIEKYKFDLVNVEYSDPLDVLQFSTIPDIFEFDTARYQLMLSSYNS